MPSAGALALVLFQMKKTFLLSGDLCAQMINRHILVFYSSVNKVFLLPLELASFIPSLYPTHQLILTLV